MVGVYLRLRAAYQAECDRQERLLMHEIEITKAKALAFEAMGRAAAVPNGANGDGINSSS